MCKTSINKRSLGFLCHVASNRCSGVISSSSAFLRIFSQKRSSITVSSLLHSKCSLSRGVPYQSGAFSIFPSLNCGFAMLMPPFLVDDVWLLDVLGVFLKPRHPSQHILPP